MANELSIVTTLSVSKSNLQLSRTANYRADVSGTHASLVEQAIGTSNEALDIHADIATKGFAYFRNTDATNYIEIGVRDGSAVFIPFAKLKPGETALFRISAATTLYGKANTATATLEHTCVED